MKPLLSNDSSVQAIVERRLRGRAAVERRGFEAVGAHDGDLAVVEMHDALRVTHQRRRIRGDEHLALADAEHDRAAVARDDDRFGPLRVEHREAVRAGHEPQRGAHRIFELVRRHRRDQVREHFGVGFGLERDAAGLQLRAQLRGVLDDAVVNDREASGAVAVRMRVAVARLAVRRPARVRDARRAFQLRGQLPFQLADFALALEDAELVVARAGDARRVVAAIFQTMQIPPSGSAPRWPVARH